MPEICTLVLTPGQAVDESLYEFMRGKKWKRGVILAGIGAVDQVCLTTPTAPEFPGQAPGIRLTQVEEPCEVVSFTGEIIHVDRVKESLKRLIRLDSEYLIHVHASVAYGGGEVAGGGFRTARVFGGMNIYMMATEL